METRASELDCLWQPITIGSLSVANRIFVPAHGTLHDRDRYARYLAERARGGAGLLLTGAIPVHPSSLLMSGWLQGWRDEHERDYAQLARAVHDEGGRLFAQIYHAGAQDAGTAPIDDWHATLAPSAIPSPVFGRIPKAIESREIDEIVAAFGRAAEIALAGGVDGLEVHGAHGYLVHAFLSPLTNHRSDEYGGTAENRCRFALEVGAEIRRRCGRDPVVGMRINFDDFVGPDGITPARAAETLRLFDAAGHFDYFSVSAGNYFALHRIVPSMSSGISGHAVPHAAAARAIVRPSTVVMVAGAVHTVAAAAAIVRAGDADMVGMARAHIADPAIVRKARDGHLSEIRRCVGANQGCWRRALGSVMVTCTVNPAAGREDEMAALAAGAPYGRRALVVGGGPAGMKAAESAALAGFAVTLIEREPQLGGAVRIAARLPGRERWLDLVDDLEASLRRLGVRIDVGVTASAALVRERGAEHVVVATGSTWGRGECSPDRLDGSSIPGADAPHVLDPVAAIERGPACGPRVVVVDEMADTIALGVAELLATAGCAVRIVTAAPSFGARVGPTTTADLPWILPRLRAAGVRLQPETSVARIGDDHVQLDQPDGPIEVAADTVVLVTTRRSDVDLYNDLIKCGSDATRIGDCLTPREVDDAVYEGARWALNLRSSHQYGTG